MPNTDRFPNLLKDTRIKLCDALGRPHNHGKHVIQNIGANGYRINPALYTCDVWQLHDLLAQAVTASDQEKTAALMAAVDLYAGPYLKDIPHGWAHTASRTVNREVVQALAELADLETAPARAVLHLERATDIDTTAEHLYRRRMQMYADRGRAEAVHHCYEQLNDRLKACGKKPEATTVQLYLRLTAGP